MRTRILRRRAAIATRRGERHAAAEAARLDQRNRESLAPVTGDAPVIVSLTSHGPRLDDVHLAIESIAAGRVRPRRLILWVDDPERHRRPSRGLRRLIDRGLELRLSNNYGPATKFYPTLAELAPDEVLATSDDDQLYPEDWLATLAAAAARQPDLVHCHRARRVTLIDGELAPYASWPMSYSAKPSYRTFATGVSGVIYPRRVIEALRAEGDAFMECAPKADDIWLHRVTVDAGVRIAQLSSVPRHFAIIPGSQDEALNLDNLRAGANDAQLAATYTDTTMRRLREETA